MSITINGTTGVSGVDGSSTTPAFQGTDTNTGLFYGTDIVGISTGGSERVRVDASGNVGIGTTSPNARLTINDTNKVTDSFGLISVLTTDSQAANLGGQIGLGGAWNGTTQTVFGAIAGRKETSTNAEARGYLQFSTLNNSVQERMRITSGGEVYIAGTTDQGAYNLQCNGTGVWGAGAYVNGSDERIKQDITPIDTGLDVVAKLNPVTYKYKEDWSKDQNIQTGFIAQDLLVALEGKNYVDGIVQQGGEYMSVAYQNIIPILTKAIQEQQTIINDLKARVTALEASNV